MNRRLTQVFAGVFLIVMLCSVAMADENDLAIALADENDLARSNGYWNGRAWEKMSQSKVIYLMGLTDGIALGIQIANPNEKEASQKQMDKSTTPGFQLNEVIKQLDDFYSDIRNINIAIARAYEFVGKKLKGDLTPEEASDWLIRMRKVDSSNRKQP